MMPRDPLAVYAVPGIACLVIGYATGISLAAILAGCVLSLIFFALTAEHSFPAPPPLSRSCPTAGEDKTNEREGSPIGKNEV